MPHRTHTNIHGRTGGGNIFYDHRFDLLYKVAKEQDISEVAKKRLRWLDHYAKVKNVALTCRYFGISESCFWKWKARFEQRNLKGLEDYSRRPKKVRTPEASPDLIEKVQKLRKLFPMYGKEKIKHLLQENVSTSTIGRIISRYHMFYRSRKKPRGNRWRWGKKKRIQDLVLHGKPGEHIEMDTIIMHRYSQTYYTKTAVDTVTKIAFAYVYSRNTSMSSVDFLQKLQYVLPYKILNIHTDNGSEFLGKFEEELHKQNIPHYFSYPHCPKQHAAIERFNRTLQEEFLQEGNFFAYMITLNKKLMEWLIEYNFHRPHASLKYQNPLAFYEQNWVQFQPVQPSSMYWTLTLAFTIGSSIITIFRF